MLKFVLLPFALICALFAAMAGHVMGTSLYRQSSWLPVSVRVVEAKTQCELTYQPADGVLRQTAAIGDCDEIDTTALPQGGSTPRIFMGEFGKLAYDISGKAMDWQGKLSDAGVYNAKAGQTLSLIYNPRDPHKLDTAAMKGWKGGLALLLLFGGFPIFYIWFFWLRRR